MRFPELPEKPILYLEGDNFRRRELGLRNVGFRIIGCHCSDVQGLRGFIRLSD